MSTRTEAFDADGATVRGNMNPTEEQLSKLADMLKKSNTVEKRVLADTIRWHLTNDTSAQLATLWRQMWERVGFSESFRL